MTRNARTVILQEDIDITTSYQTIEQPADLGAIFAHGGQVVLSFKRTSGTSITFQVEEYFGELTGWVTHVEDDGTNLAAKERTSTEAAFQYAFSTLAEKVRVKVKGATGNEVLDLYLTVGEIS